VAVVSNSSPLIALARIQRLDLLPAITVRDLETLEIRTCISEPDRGPQSWIDQDAEREAVYANRRRIRGDRGQRLLRKRGELLERPCALLTLGGTNPDFLVD
jgi:hypothetical protein